MTTEQFEKLVNEVTLQTNILESILWDIQDLDIPNNTGRLLDVISKVKNLKRQTIESNRQLVHIIAGIEANKTVQAFS